MDGLGALYSRVSSYIFADWNKCGEVMGLAPYGRPDSFKRLLEFKDGELHVPEWDAEFNQPWMPDDKNKWEASPAMPHWEDMAWRVQHDAEEVLLARARWLRETTGARNLCLAGGVALNCVANGRIVREAGFDNVWIQPAAGDNGIAIGCAYYGRLAVQKKPRSFVMKQATLGVAYPDEVTQRAGNPLLVDAHDVQRARPEHLPRSGEIVGGGQGVRLVPGPLRIRAARARQPEHPGRSAAGRDEGHPEQAGEVPAGLPSVCADRAL